MSEELRGRAKHVILRPSYKNYVLLVLLCVYTFNYLDRQVLSVSLEAIKESLSVSDTQLGLLTGAGFAVCYSLVGIPIARWADRGNRSLIIALALALLGVTVALCSAVTSFSQLLFSRLWVGVAEAGLVPPTLSLVSSYFARSERPRAMAVVLQGGPLSLVLGSIVGGWLTEIYGWRIPFLVVAVPGFLLAAIVRSSLRDPRCCRSVRGLPIAPRKQVEDQAHEFVDSAKRASVANLFAQLWRQRTFRYLLIAFGFDYLCGFGLQQWIPVFFVRVHGMPTGVLGNWLAVDWGLANAIGTLLGGFITGRTTINAEQRQLRFMTATALAYVLLTAVVLTISSATVALVVMFVATLCNAFAMAPSFALLQSLVPEDSRATAIAGVFLLGNLVGLGLGPLAVGLMSDGLAPSYGVNSLRLALLFCLPGYLLVALHYFRASLTVAHDLVAAEAQPSNADGRGAG